LKIRGNTQFGIALLDSSGLNPVDSVYVAFTEGAKVRSELAAILNLATSVNRGDGDIRRKPLVFIIEPKPIITFRESFSWATHKYRTGQDKHIFTRDGMELNFKIPDGAFFEDIHSFGAQTKDDETIAPKSLPEDTHLIIRIDDDWALCDLKGSIQRLRQKTEIRSLVPHNLLGPGEIPGFPRDRGQMRLPYVSMIETFQEVTPDRLVKTILLDTGKFDLEYWSANVDGPIPRLAMFNRFLNQHDLIGMDEKTLSSFLGPGVKGEEAADPTSLRTVSYWVQSGGCDSNATVYIRIYLDNGNVKSWKFYIGKKESEPIIYNVVLSPVERKTLEPGGHLRPTQIFPEFVFK